MDNWSEITYQDRPRAAWHLFVEHEDGKRYLINTAKVGIERLVYSTYAFYNSSRALCGFEHDTVYSSRPYFEIKDLPSGGKVYLEDVDPYEDGTIVFRLEEVDWADGVHESDSDLGGIRQLFDFLSAKRRKDLISEIKAASVQDLLVVERDKTKVAEDPGRVVRDTNPDEDE